jgi:hypothetical protein
MGADDSGKLFRQDSGKQKSVAGRAHSAKHTPKQGSRVDNQLKSYDFNGLKSPLS